MFFSHQTPPVERHTKPVSSKRRHARKQVCDVLIQLETLCFSLLMRYSSCYFLYLQVAAAPKARVSASVQKEAARKKVGAVLFMMWSEECEADFCYFFS